MESNDGQVTFDPGQMAVEIESMRQLLNTTACKAFFKVRFKTAVGSICIDNFRLVENKKGDMFVASPSHKKGDKYFDDIQVTEDLAKYLRGAAVMHYNKAYKQ